MKDVVSLTDLVTGIHNLIELFLAKLIGSEHDVIEHHADGVDFLQRLLQYVLLPFCHNSKQSMAKESVPCCGIQGLHPMPLLYVSRTLRRNSTNDVLFWLQRYTLSITFAST